MPLFRPHLVGLGLSAIVAVFPASARAQMPAPVPIDLGTLGGVHSWAEGVSDTGVVGGCSWLPDDFQCNVFGWTASTGMTPLTPAAGFGSVYGVSPSGLVVGLSQASPADAAHAYVWSPLGGFVDLGPGSAHGVSANDLVFGTSSQGAFAWTAQQGTTPIGTLGGTWTFPEAASPNGMVVGWSDLPGNPGFHAFAWTRSGGLVDVGPPGSNSFAVGASNDGAVAGNNGNGPFVRMPNGTFVFPAMPDGAPAFATRFSANGVLIGDTQGRAFAWTPATGTVLLTLGGTRSHARVVSNTGIVAGWSYLPDDTTRHAFIWTEAGGMVDLGGTNSSALVVNDHGLVAGLDNGLPFAWTRPTGMVPLGTLGGNSHNVLAISNTGLIAGHSSTAEGAPSESHAVLWTFGYAFSGFFQPVDSAPTVNVVKGGSAVPLKFSLGADLGLNILASNSPVSSPVSCNTSSPLDEVEETISAGGSSLSYDAVAGQYVYVWKTSSAWKNTCRQLTLRLADGSAHSAIFKFK